MCPGLVFTDVSGRGFHGAGVATVPLGVGSMEALG